ncbi:MAG: PHB depolymerase family esterase [Hoeflea sp.]|uniref:extracellular catalytic domain type 1 short-chain-length polyhydroxyalkanoate depolymerase n=1 Tax=Hoeflea sp. TaxID=1940281 RepID=UPI0032993B11
MNIFDTGAKHPARADARLARLAAANDLVRRTLARHGLMPEAGTEPRGGLSPAMSPLSGLAGLQTVTGGGATPADVVPGGAQFRQGLFECEAGSRPFLTYVPDSATQGVSGIVVMLHGCTQTPEVFATGTGMNALAELHRLVVIYPQQSRGHNAQSCWNWFSRGDQRRDRGEPAILAGLTRQIMAEHEVPGDRTFVAGLSAGAAMAVIMGETYPDIFSAVGAHSGLAFGAANDVPSAFAAMAGRGSAAVRSTGEATNVRTIVFHGSSDSTVHPANGDQIAINSVAHCPEPTIETIQQGYTGGRSFERKITTTADGRVKLEHWIVDGLGHAWSGGQPGGSYTDSRGPDASYEMIRFFLDAADQDI